MSGEISNTRDKHSIIQILSNSRREELKFLKPKLVPTSRDSYKFSLGGEEISVKTTPRGDVYEEEIKKIARVISKETGRSLENSYNLITRTTPKPLGIERRVVNGALILLSIGLLTLLLSQTKLLTGYAISNIPNTVSNIGIFICIAGILGLLYYRNKFK